MPDHALQDSAATAMINICVQIGLSQSARLSVVTDGLTSKALRDLASLAFTSSSRFCSCLSCSLWYSAFSLHVNTHPVMSTQQQHPLKRLLQQFLHHKNRSPDACARVNLSRQTHGMHICFTAALTCCMCCLCIEQGRSMASISIATMNMEPADQW